MRTFRPSDHPSLASACRNAIARRGVSGSVSFVTVTTPTRRIPSPCCARAASGHAAAPPSSVMNSRRLIRSPRRRRRHVASKWMPVAFAVRSLTASSNLVGCSTGKSAGFAPAQGSCQLPREQPEHLREARSVSEQPPSFVVSGHPIDRRQWQLKHSRMMIVRRLPCRSGDASTLSAAAPPALAASSAGTISSLRSTRWMESSTRASARRRAEQRRCSRRAAKQR